MFLLRGTCFENLEVVVVEMQVESPAVHIGEQIN